MAELKTKNLKPKTKNSTQKPAPVKSGLKAESVKTEKVVKTSEKNTEVKSVAPVFDLTGKKTGTLSLPKELFGGKVNEELIAQAIRVYLTNQRQGTSSTKTRGEVTGSRRKVWRQKGTGRARHGSITGPVFVGGGIVHGPKPRDFGQKMPKKMKLQALVSALTEKSNENMVFVIDGKLNGKTKEFALLIKNILGANKKNPSALFVRSKSDKEALLASRNVDRVSTVMGGSINTYEVVKNSAIILSKDAIDEMKEAFIKA